VSGVGTSIQRSVVAGVGVAGVAALLVLQADASHTHDEIRYLAMAEDRMVEAPFGYRVLVPRIVALLPWSHDVGFRLITVLSLGATAVIVHRWISMHVRSDRAVIATALLAVSGPMVFVTTNPYLTDGPAWLVIAATLLLADAGRSATAGAVNACGVLVRESVVAALVVPAVRLARTRCWRDLTLLLAPAVAVLVVTRATPILWGEAVPGSGVMPFGEVLSQQAEWYGSVGGAAVIAIAYSWGAAMLASPAWIRSALPDVRTPVAVYGACCLAPLLIAVDWTRLLGHLFPLVCLAAARSHVPNGRLWTVIGLQAVASGSIVLHGWRPSVAFAATLLVAQIVALSGPFPTASDGARPVSTA
jgi:hypothetical protein